MKWLGTLRRATIFLLLLSIGLGVVTMRSMTFTRRWTERLDSAITSYALAERSLQIHLLAERAGGLRSYDPVNADLALANNSLAILQRSELSERARKILSAIIPKYRQQEDMVQQFNSNNAILQNSLLYVTDHGSATLDMQVLLNRILKLTLDTSPQTVRETQAELRRMPSPPEGTPAARTLAHARLLVEILPELDQLLSSLHDLRMQESIGEFHATVMQDAAERMLGVRRLELALAVVIILLVITIAIFFLAQRLHIRELQSRAANERLSAAIAIPLIDTGPGTFLSRAQDSAQRLALHIGARRLQLSIPGIANCAQYSRSDVDLASDWLPKLADAADIDGIWLGDRVIASRSEIPAESALGRAMLDADVDDLILLRTTEPVRVMIGFEPEDFTTAQRRDYLAGVSSAIIAIAHSARREVLQLEREHLEQSLTEKRRMANLGAIASGVAHNFNNIIGAISGFAEIGQARAKKNSVEYSSFEEIEIAVKRARDLIDDILHYAKDRRTGKAPLNIVDVLTETIRMLSVSMRDDVEFQFERPDERYIIYGAESDIQQVLLNICNNAAHASDGKPVQISLYRSSIDEKCRMSHDSLYPGKYVVVTIEDTGPGIPLPLQRKLFEPFFTTKSGGTGLGLSTAWEIIQGHGGTIDVDRPPAGGARFSVWLPELAAAADGAVIGNGARVLLITEADRLAVEEDMLAELGYEPLGFPLSAEIDRILEVVDTVDAILIATWQSWRADEIARAVTPFLGKRPLLLAIPEDDAKGHSYPFQLLSHPIRPDQISVLLSQAAKSQIRQFG